MFTSDRNLRSTSVLLYKILSNSVQTFVDQSTYFCIFVMLRRSLTIFHIHVTRLEQVHLLLS